ncbi:hypothetical protein JVU11DRAFT_6785 [Chiua virens]|nr:hypothetical protein JVU11DRAFT_6785 [Chiua virens]
MSTTPTANIASDTFPIHQTPSRHPEYDVQVPLSHCTAPSSADSPLTADLTSSHNSAQGPSHHSPPDQDVTRRPTKRQRRSPSVNMAAERASSSSDVSSQSGMADNETEPEPSHLSEAQPVTAPPKKKRTRTLTTPHQSAVLHALLAKSRFPTTVAREEVGRQIGLSARKVQNQRQKARRPQSESAPLTRPPQFGPFPIMTPAGPSSTSNPSPTASGPSEVSHSASSSARDPHESGESLDSIPPLSGPGMPGWSLISFAWPSFRRGMGYSATSTDESQNAIGTLSPRASPSVV